MGPHCPRPEPNGDLPNLSLDFFTAFIAYFFPAFYNCERFIVRERDPLRAVFQPFRDRLLENVTGSDSADVCIAIANAANGALTMACTPVIRLIT